MSDAKTGRASPLAPAWSWTSRRSQQWPRARRLEASYSKGDKSLIESKLANNMSPEHEVGTYYAANGRRTSVTVIVASPPNTRCGDRRDRSRAGLENEGSMVVMDARAQDNKPAIGVRCLRQRRPCQLS